MDKSYAMAKFGLESKDILRSRQKGCWHYMKYFFIFSSIIQFLIILGLVLFMLYGNAHGGTELRLKSVENRYKELVAAHSLLMENFNSLKKNLTASEKNHKNCSDTLMKTQATSSLNRTTLCPRFPPNCNNIQNTMDFLNMSRINERLKAQNEKIICDHKLKQHEENYTKTIDGHNAKNRAASSEIIQLKRDNKDLGTQINLLQESCTKINEKFRLELQSLTSVIETAIPGNSYDSTMRCRPISDLLNNRIDITLGRLRQDVNAVVYENTQIKVTNVRINEDLEKCKQGQTILTEEKKNLATEKASLQNEVTVKKDELSKFTALYLKKEEELSLCRRQQTRPQFPPQFPLRT